MAGFSLLQLLGFETPKQSRGQRALKLTTARSSSSCSHLEEESQSDLDFLRMTQSISKGAVTMGLRMKRVGLDFFLVLVCMACKETLSLSLSLHR